MCPGDAGLSSRATVAPHRRGAAIVILLSGLWLLSHLYRGIVGDAVLYAAQALSHLYPEIFRGDIFFAYGSQDDYTVFGRLYALAISAIGLNAAALTIVMLAHTLWAGASWQIARILPSPRRWVFLALLFTLPPFYAAEIFTYSESLATARVVAEAFALAAFAALLAGRHIAAVLLILAALMLHPLMAIWGAIFLAFFLAQRYRWRPLVAALVLAAIPAAALSGAAGLLPAMDGEWLTLVRSRNAYVFVTTWSARNFNLLTLNFCVLAAAWRLCADPTLRRLFLSALAMGGVALALALGGEWLHNVLLIQVQPWRAFWIVQWMTILAYAALLGGNQGEGRQVALLFATAWLAQDTLGGAVALATLLLTASATRKARHPRLLWALLAAAALG